MDSNIFSNGITLAIVGMSVVFITLAALAVTLSVIARKESPAESVPEESALKPSDDMSPELIVVLAAAATAALRRPVRVKKVVLLGHTKDAWIAGGRATIMASHNPHLHKARSRQ